MTTFEMLRTKSNWSRKKLAELIGQGLTIRMIYSYERENAKPNTDILIAYADLFSVSIDFLLGRETNVSAFNVHNLYRELNISCFGKRIQEYRIKNSFDKKTIAEAAGITVTHLSAIENGSKIPKMGTAVKILNALQAPADYALMDVLVASAPLKSLLLSDEIAALPADKKIFVLNLVDVIIKSV